MLYKFDDLDGETFVAGPPKKFTGATDVNEANASGPSFATVGSPDMVDNGPGHSSETVDYAMQTTGGDFAKMEPSDSEEFSASQDFAARVDVWVGVPGNAWQCAVMKAIAKLDDSGPQTGWAIYATGPNTGGPRGYIRVIDENDNQELLEIDGVSALSSSAWHRLTLAWQDGVLKLFVGTPGITLTKVGEAETTLSGEVFAAVRDGDLTLGNHEINDTEELQSGRIDNFAFETGTFSDSDLADTNW